VSGWVTQRRTARRRQKEEEEDDEEGNSRTEGEEDVHEARAEARRSMTCVSEREKGRGEEEGEEEAQREDREEERMMWVNEGERR
jgi:hypothetical protein